MAVNAFLKIDGIVGDHKGEVQLESFSWGVSNSGSSVCGGVGEGRASFQDFSFTAQIGSQSPALFLAAATGRHIKMSTVKTDLLEIKMQDVIVSSYKEDLSFHKLGEEGQVSELEFVSFNFAKVEITVRTNHEAFDVCARR